MTDAKDATTTASDPRRRPRVAVVATPFGFGPASKAYSIGEVLRTHWGVDVQYYGTDSARDFFSAQPDVRPLAPEAVGGTGAIDAVLNVLAPDLIRSSEEAARTYYVDSLGFMWQPSDIPDGSLLTRVHRYFAQDVFGSVDHLTALGITGVTPVSGIVAETAPTGISPGPRSVRRLLVQLGGLSNPAGRSSGEVYLALAAGLLTALRQDPYELSIAMNRAGGTFSLGSLGQARQLSGRDFHRELATCAGVLSSPGMTTLIEVSRAKCPYVPLPPQNWSQVLISRHMARHSRLGIWDFLIGPYATVDARAPEAQKAAQVGEINQSLAGDTGYTTAYVDLARTALAEARVPDVGAPFDGAHVVAASIADDLIKGTSRCGRGSRTELKDHGTPTGEL
ncbi:MULTISPECIES: hypothetical protein [Streptomyces]|uniref:hypothetical protein n=1 Tax=Streptomyces TaxID=1883 RepID=UPI00088C8412|nr:MULTISPECIES: hypothetical protein [Streptomyces]MYW78037.1 hypothetical protein [Streptomyces sp. SID8369]QRV52998.1 hypothetical protein I6J40_01500 [Streptomyces californicus]SDC58388.1 hypothetical protein F610DRAFT_02204 [Streptomyces sp. LaPpAH-199]